MNLFRFIPGYESYIYDESKEPLLFLFLAFLITFALVRLYTRLARTRGWGSGNVGGVHMHHMVVGVILMALGGGLAFTQFAASAVFYSVCAIIFAIGAALTLDEFAMVFHLKDVYWAEEGRTSIDALIVGAGLAGLLLVSASPFTTEGEAKPGSDVSVEFTIGGLDIKVGAWLALLTSFFVAVIVFLKKKPFVAILGIGFLPIGIIGAMRLGKPGSPWSRWFYDPSKGTSRSRVRRERKLRRSFYRYTEGRYGRFERWFSDLVGGAPDPPPTATNDDPHEESPTHAAPTPEPKGQRRHLVSIP
jgi:hypothetical protein